MCGCKRFSTHSECIKLREMVDKLQATLDIRNNLQGMFETKFIYNYI